MYRHIYGPIPSRRLGISLGVDLIPHKVCSFNCVYCECGKNTRLTVERKEYVPAGEVLAEIDDFMHRNPHPDYISFSGSGEPTLNSSIGEIIRTIKQKYPETRVAVFTNGSLLFEKEVRESLYPADVVLPSLDAATREGYISIDRPHPSLDLEKVINGIAEFSREYHASNPSGQLWLEVFIVEGINTGEDSVIALKKAAERIMPDRVQLNSLDRPGTEPWVRPASLDELKRIQESLSGFNCEIIASFKDLDRKPPFRQDQEQAVLDTLTRRPSTRDDIASVLGMPAGEASRLLAEMEDKGLIKKHPGGDTARQGFYTVK